VPTTPWWRHKNLPRRRTTRRTISRLDRHGRHIFCIINILHMLLRYTIRIYI
jgi:hypothetical protein